MTIPSLASLIATAQQFYPLGIGPWDERYTETPEYGRAREAWRHALQNKEPWQRVLALLRERASPPYRVRELTVPYMHQSWRVALLREGTPYIAVGCVSVLAPVYFCYGLNGLGHDPEVLLQQQPQEVAEGAATIESIIQEVFRYEPLSVDVALAIVPGVEIERCPPHGATLLAALISNDLNHYV
ncbi:hypothetical protein [Hyalangium sp.]|uniref:hypothetical protein n=1 Tax=Hyalangium sp. TaxID=2028555 RepID=UPI002D3DF5E3|nr:hypothetical protein [Hyalangium sp.]HYI00791.1 hypothetical protein [Hyalangium sp.]